MIFRSFNNDDGFLSKIGIYKKSFKEIGEAFKNAFNTSVTGFADDTIWGERKDKGFIENLKRNLISPIEEEMDLYDKLIVKKKDIEPFLTDLSIFDGYDDKAATKDFKKIKQHRNEVNKKKATWDDYFSKLKPNQKWQKKLITETDGDISNINQLKEAQAGAAQAAADHNLQLKNLTLSAKAGKVALGALKMVGNAALMAGVTMAISFVVKQFDNYINRIKYAKEALEESKAAYDNTGKEIDDLNTRLQDCNKQIQELESTQGISLIDNAEYNKLKDTRSELETMLQIKQAEQKIEAREQMDNAAKLYNSGFKTVKTEKTDMGYVHNKQVTPDIAMSDAIDDYNQKLAKNKSLKEELVSVSEKINNTTDTSSREYKKLIIQQSKVNQEITKNEKELTKSQKNIVDLHNSINDIKVGMDDYTSAGYALNDSQQQMYNAISGSVEAYAAWAKSLNEATDAEQNAANGSSAVANSFTNSTEQMKTLKETVDDVVSSYKSLDAAILAQQTGQSINLTDDLSAYASCLEYTNGVMQLNSEKAKALAQSKAEEQIATIESTEAQERYQYSINASKIDEYTAALDGKNKVVLNGKEITSEMVQALKQDNEQIVLNAKNYQLMTSQIREATGTYQAWLDAQNAPTQGAMFTDAGNAIELIMESLKNGKVGTDAYKSALGFLVPDSIDSEDKEAISKYLKTLQRYFADNGSGVNNFIADAIQKGLMTKTEDGADIVKGTRIDDFVEKLNLTEEAVRAIFGEAETYGSKFNWNLDGLNSLDDALFEAQTKYDELRNDFEQNGLTIEVNQDDINNAKKALEQLSEYGNVNLTNRQKVSGKTMRDKGWTDFNDDDVATTYTMSDFVWQGDEDTGKYVYVHYTPILPDGSVLSPDELSKYIDETLNGTKNILETDSDNKRIVMKVDDGISHEDSVNYKQTGEMSSVMNRIVQQGNSWDEKVHEYQATFYNLVDQDLQKLNDEYGQTSKQFKDLAKQRADMFSESYSGDEFQSLKDEYDLVNKASQLRSLLNKGIVNGDAKSYEELSKQYEVLRKELSQTYGVDIEADGAAQVLQDLQQQMITLSGLSSFNVNIIADQAKQELQNLQNDLQELENKLKKVENSLSSADGDKYLSLSSEKEQLEKQIAEKKSQIKGKEEEIDWITTLKVKLDESVKEAQDKKDELSKDQEFKVTANTEQAIEKINELKDLLNGLSTNLDIGDPLPVSTNPSGSTSTSKTTKTNGRTKSYSKNGPAAASGTKGETVKTETALIGELGPEIVVDPKTGSWRTYGDNGAEFASIPKGSIVFDANKSKELLERGFVNGRGIAYASGTAYGKTDTNPNSVSGSFVNAPVYGESRFDEKAKELGKTADKASKATDKLAKSTKDATEAEGNLVDWIERRITLLDNQASLLSKKSSSAYLSYFGMTEEQFKSISELMSDPTNVENYTEGIRQLGEISKNTGKSMDELQATITSGKFEESRLSANASQLKINDEKIQTLRSAIEQYQAKYEGYMAKIPQEYRDKIESGALTLENFAQETSKDSNAKQGSSLYDNLQKGIEYYDKVKSSESSLFDAQEEHYKILEEKHNNYIGKLEKENTLLQTQASLTQKGIDLAKASGHIVSADSYESLISNNKLQQNNMRNQINGKIAKLKELDPKEDTEKYLELENEIESARVSLKDLKLEQANLNKELKEMPITNMTTVINMYKDISTAIQNWGAELEASGTALTADYYQELIKNGSTIISEYKEQAGIIKDVMDTYDVGSDNWNELYSQLQNVNGEMSSMIQNLKKWNEELLQLPLTKISNYSSDLNTVKDALSSLQDDYTTVISAVTGAIDDETKAIQDQQKEFQKNIEKQKDAIQDKIDLLDKQNTKLQLQNQLEQSLYDLQIANTQKTQKIIRNGEEIYVTDADKIREAQKAYQDAQYSKTKNDLQEQLDALNDQLDDYNDKVDEQLEALDKIKEKWSEIAENVTKAQNATFATDYLGAGWKDKVLSGNDADIYNAFKNQYEQNASQLKAYEDQIQSTERIYNLLNSYIEAYKAGTITANEAQTQIQGLLNQLNKGLISADANLMNVLQYSKDITGASGSSAEQVLAGIKADLKTSGDNLITSLKQYEENSKLIGEQTTSWQQLTKDVSEMLSVLKDVKKALKESERDDDDEDEDDDSSSKKKHHSKSDGPGKSAWSNKDENNGPGAEINRKKAGIAHSGLEAGVVGSGVANDDEAWMKLMGLKELDPNEYPYILKAGEQIVNDEQRRTLMSNFNNAYSSAYADGIKRGISAMSSLGTQVNNAVSNVKVNIEKIMMNNVQDPDGFAKALYNNLELTMAQQRSKFKF